DAALKEREALQLFNQGKAHLKAAAPQLAEPVFLQALPLWEKLASESRRPEYRHNLAATLQNIAVAEDQQGRAAQAEENFRRALAVYDELSAEFPDYRKHEANRDLARERLRVLSWAGEILKDAAEAEEGKRLEEAGRTAEAAEHFRRAIDLHRRRQGEFS